MKRVYAVPFAQVWRAALAAAGAVEGWTILDQEPGPGRIRAESRTRFPQTATLVEVRISLDEAGLTRLVVTTELRSGRFDFGVNRSRARRFLERLERALIGPRTR